MLTSNIGQEAAEFDRVRALIEEASGIAVCAHTSPDGDAIGSCLALAEIIESQWPDKSVTVLLADDDDVPRTYSFLPGVERHVHVADYDRDPDLFICVDLSQPSRLNLAEAVLARAKKVAVLDHHPSSECFWDAGVVRPDAAAAGVIVAEFALHVGTGLTATMAQNLMCAIVTDTGRFQYSNADGEAFEVASMLVDAGASPSEIALHVYQSDRLAYIHLCAVIMARISTFGHGKIAYSYATAADFKANDVPLAECDGLIDLVRCVDGSEVALFLKEVPGGKVRGNLRSKCDLDISGIARELGGGGHKAAAGFTVEGTIDDALAAALPRLHQLFVEAGEAQGEAN
ncbi:DHH family phosphoesterase [Paratractidigestivibacter sp.]|uniref:DHH family phosphoesterase n=1 Tax=Paratractidigestivibacter sp. TaxID=2847316 RepID=UPI002ABD8C4F|nr:DHH family phosphoesterase [Paratractidigestivibacter sp.]